MILCKFCNKPLTDLIFDGNDDGAQYYMYKDSSDNHNYLNICNCNEQYYG